MFDCYSPQLKQHTIPVSTVRASKQTTTVHSTMPHNSIKVRKTLSVKTDFLRKCHAVAHDKQHTEEDPGRVRGNVTS